MEPPKSHVMMRRATLDHLPPLPPLADGYELRPLRPADLPALAHTLHAAFDDPTWTVARVREELIDLPNVIATFVVDQAGRAVATASGQVAVLTPGAGYLHWVASDPAHRGKHLGAAVSIAALHALAAHGCREALLRTDDHRLAAIKTYLALGFVPLLTDATHAARWAAINQRLASTARPAPPATPGA